MAARTENKGKLVLVTIPSYGAALPAVRTLFTAEPREIYPWL